MTNPYLDKLNALGFTWALMEVDGSDWKDAFGNHDGTIVGAAVTTNEIVLNQMPPNVGDVVEADGVDDFVRVPHHTDLQPSDEVTVAWWVRVESASESWAGHITKGDNTWQLRRNSSSNLALALSWDVRGGTGGSEAARGNLDTNYPMSTDVRLLVATYDGSDLFLWASDDSGTMYQVATASRSGTIGSDSGSDLCVFAQDNSGTLRRFLGGWGAAPSMAPVGITLEQAQELYDAAFEEPEPSKPTVLATAIGRSDFPSSLTHDVELPVGITAGERLLMMFQSTNSISQVSGWDELGNIGNRFYIFHRIADGTEGPTVTVEMSGSTTHWASNVYRISGVGNGPEVEFGINGVNDPPEVIASWGSDDNLFIAAMSNQRTDQIVSAPTDYTNFITAASEDNSSVSSRIRVSSARRELVSALDDPGPFGVDGDIQDEKCATLVFGGLGVITDFDPANLQVTVDGTTGQLSWDASPLLAP